MVDIHLTPLRERTDDIPPLVTHFIEKCGNNLGKKLDISLDALRLLVSLPWEGNVRELENTIERAAILCENGLIMPEDVQPGGDTPQGGHPWIESLNLAQFIPEGTPLAEIMDGIEERLVREALEAADYVQARAAKQLGITKSLLQYKMKKYKLQRPKRDA